MQQPDPRRSYAYSNDPPVYRFPQNQPHAIQGPAPQPPTMCDACPYRKEQHRHARRRRFSIIRSIFTFIGVVTVLVLLARYVIIPAMVYLNTLAGGTL